MRAVWRVDMEVGEKGRERNDKGEDMREGKRVMGEERKFEGK